jgi:hypothetical protein
MAGRAQQQLTRAPTCGHARLSSVNQRSFRIQARLDSIPLPRRDDTRRNTTRIQPEVSPFFSTAFRVRGRTVSAHVAATGGKLVASWWQAGGKLVASWWQEGGGRSLPGCAWCCAVYAARRLRAPLRSQPLATSVPSVRGEYESIRIPPTAAVLMVKCFFCSLSRSGPLLIARIGGSGRRWRLAPGHLQRFFRAAPASRIVPAKIPPRATSAARIKPR